MAILPIYEGEVLVMQLEHEQRRKMTERRKELVEKTEKALDVIRKETDGSPRPPSADGRDRDR